MPRTRHALFLAAGVLAVAPARALEPPPSEAELIRDGNEAAVEKALARCSAEAARRGTFTVVKVEFPYGVGEKFAPALASASADLDRPAYWCVTEALRALRLDPLPAGDKLRVRCDQGLRARQRAIAVSGEPAAGLARRGQPPGSGHGGAALQAARERHGDR
jgi:hypothetical protein